MTSLCRSSSLDYCIVWHFPNQVILFQKSIMVTLNYYFIQLIKSSAFNAALSNWLSYYLNTLMH